MTFVLIPLLLGLWEMGRLVHVQQVVSNSAREGARLAAQGVTINQAGSPTLISSAIHPSANSEKKPNVKAVILQALHGAGFTTLTWDDVTVTFQFMDSPAGAIPGATEPHQGVKGQRFKVLVSIPFKKVRWVDFGLISTDTVSYEVEWRAMADAPFKVNTTMPAW